MKLTKKQAKEIRAFKRMKAKDIDLTDIPEVVNPGKAFVGKFYRPIKKSLTVRFDMRPAIAEPEILRTIGLESKRKGTSRVSSRQINQIIKAARGSKSNR
jgi:hypothetical protein